jgi:hypothetical protein
MKFHQPKTFYRSDYVHVADYSISERDFYIKKGFSVIGKDGSPKE